MKISYRTHPILKSIDEENLNGLQLLDADIEMLLNEDFTHNADKYFNLSAKKFQSEIKYFSEPFLNAFDEAKGKLFSSQQLHETNTQSGVYLIGNSTYCFDYDADDENLKLVLFIFNRINERAVPTVIFIYDKKNNIRIDWHSKFFAPWDDNVYNSKIELNRTAANVMALMNFIKYCPLETKELPAGQKVKGVDCKYINDTKLKITYINSTWFTTLVKSDAFKVRGHFRLQPKKKDGEWTKEIIWINEFQKTGYTAPARKLKDNSDD